MGARGVLPGGVRMMVGVLGCWWDVLVVVLVCWVLAGCWGGWVLAGLMVGVLGDSGVTGVLVGGAGVLAGC